ncbi:hypothetical protein LBMAG29_08130 [Methylophilaceae bacterium]|nr:hypothetical protein LBMAG29_08130 [Methylophilaceae bacterium]
MLRLLNIYFVFGLIFNFTFFTSPLLAAEKTLGNTIQDPFARGVIKPPQYSTNLDREKSLNGRLDDVRALDDFRYYRILGIYQNEQSSLKNVIEISWPEKVDVSSNNAFYISLGTFYEKKLAQQAGRDFIATFINNLNRRVIIRGNKDSTFGFADRENNNKKRSPEKKLAYELEYGPFNNLEFARANCFFLRNQISQYSLDCALINKRLVHKEERIKDIASSATIGLSQAGLMALKDSPLAFNQKDLLSTVLTVYEGENLGTSDFFIVNINQYGIYVASKFDESLLIPAVTFPVNMQNVTAGGPSPGLPAAAPSKTN